MTAPPQALTVKKSRAARPAKPRVEAASHRLNPKDLQHFISGFATLLRAGMDLQKALTTLQREARGPLRGILERVLERTRSGDSLSTALTKSGSFSNFYVRVIRAGEHGGDLEGALRRLAGMLEREKEIRSKLRNAVAYPVFLICFGILAFSVILFFVLPKFLGIYKEMGTQLPFVTSVLLKLSAFGRESAIWLIPLLVISAVAILRQLPRLKRSPSFEKLRMAMPGMGRLVREMETANFLRILGLLLQSGLPAAQALRTAAEVLNSSMFRSAALAIEAGVQKGGRVSTEMAKQKIFSERVVNLVSVGEESGRLQSLLVETSEEMEKNVDQLIKTALIFLEPLLILCVGLLIGLMVMAALLPIFSLSSGLRQ